MERSWPPKLQAHKVPKISSTWLRLGGAHQLFESYWKMMTMTPWHTLGAWHPQTPKWREFLHNVLVEGLGHVLHCKGWDLIVYKNIQTNIFQIEKFPFSDMLRQGTQSETANCQKRLTKRSLRNTNRERTQHILISVIPSSRISTIPWPDQDKSILASGCLILKGYFYIFLTSFRQWHYLKPGSLSIVHFLLRCHTLKANSPESSKAFNRRVHSSWICQSTFIQHDIPRCIRRWML